MHAWPRFAHAHAHTRVAVLDVPGYNTGTKDVRDSAELNGPLSPASTLPRPRVYWMTRRRGRG